MSYDRAVWAGLLYTASHVWVKADGDTVTVGVTPRFTQKTSEVDFVELPAVGDTAQRGQRLGAVQGIEKHVEVPAPVDGSVTEVNQALLANPKLVSSDPLQVSSDPLQGGWLYKIKLADKSQQSGLYDLATYEALP